MNQKITLARLAALVAEKNGCTPKESEDVLRLLFQYISASLEGNEPIKVKGLGTFKLSQVEARKSVDVTTGEDNKIPAHQRIVFIPAKELAAAVNAPFEMFETVVIEENVLEEELMEAESEGNTLLIDSLQQQIILEEEKSDALKEKYPAEFTEDSFDESDNNTSDQDTSSQDDETLADDIPAEATPTQTASISEDKKVDSPQQDEATKNEITSTKSIEETENTGEEEDEESAASAPAKKRHGAWIWYVAGGLLALIVAIAVLWIVNDDFASKGREVLGIESKNSASKSQQETEIATLLDNEDNMVEENTDMTGLVEEEGQDKDNDAKEAELAKAQQESEDDAVPTAPSDSKAKGPTYDTITKTRYLTTLAKEHYGNFHLWPYIYKENEKILGHPDRIKPGTKVVIPDLSKYGVDPKNPNDIAKAKKLGVEIYKKYK